MEIPIPTIHLFQPLDAKLLEVLRSLSAADWQKPTLARQWTVKDIATHLLDGNIRTISAQRDQFTGEAPQNINSYSDLVAYLNELNADWVKATKRMSPVVLIELLDLTGKEYFSCLEKMDPFANARFSVAWAGENISRNWFHIAREYTEKWHHQQQIREAVNMPGIMTRKFFYPLIDTFMQALPHTWRNTSAPENTIVKIIVTGEAGGTWVLVKREPGWAIEKNDSKASAEITLNPNTAWKLFTKAITPEEAKAKIKFEGDFALGVPVLTMLSVMA